VDPHAPARFSKSLTQGWFVNVLPTSTPENPFVAQYLLQNSIWWTETTGLDGFRWIHFRMSRASFGPPGISDCVVSIPGIATIGEVFHPDPSVTSFFRRGQKRYDGIDSGVNNALRFFPCTSRFEMY